MLIVPVVFGEQRQEEKVPADYCLHQTLIQSHDWLRGGEFSEHPKSQDSQLWESPDHLMDSVKTDTFVCLSTGEK